MKLRGKNIERKLAINGVKKHLKKQIKKERKSNFLKVHCS